MSEKTFTFTECVIVIAYLCYLQSINREQPDQPPTKKKRVRLVHFVTKKEVIL